MIRLYIVVTILSFVAGACEIAALGDLANPGNLDAIGWLIVAALYIAAVGLFIGIWVTALDHEHANHPLIFIIPAMLFAVASPLLFPALVVAGMFGIFMRAGSVLALSLLDNDYQAH